MGWRRHLPRAHQVAYGRRGSTWGVRRRPRQELADQVVNALGKRGPGPKKAAAERREARFLDPQQEAGRP